MYRFKYAFSLPQEEVDNAKPPGTVSLIELHESRASTVRLVPTPSKDPADPLNWPVWRKQAILFCMTMHPFVVNFSSSSISSAFPMYAGPFAFGVPPTPFPKLAQLIAVNVLFIGAANILWVPLANTFGRRTITLLSLLMLMFTSVWAGLAPTFNGLLAARLFMGFAAATADTVSADVVGEVFFLHERGRAMGMYTVGLVLGSILGGLTGGYIVDGNSHGPGGVHEGLKWIHWVNVIMSAMLFVFCFFLQPETMYTRVVSNLREPSPISESGIELAQKNHITQIENIPSEPQSYPPFTFARSLKVGAYRPGLGRRFAGIFKTMRLPGVWLVTFWYAGLVGGVVTISTVGPKWVSMPPYLWGHDAGLINVGALIGCILGAMYTAYSADSAVKNEAKRAKGGFAEPESRLKTALPALAIASVGLWVFGACGQNPSPKAWIGLEFGYGMLSFGLMQAPAIGFTYLIESYNSVSGDCFVVVTTVRSIISFAWTFFVGDWVDKRGAAEPFGIFGMLMALFGLLTIPFILWGKRMRIATAEWVNTGHSDH